MFGPVDPYQEHLETMASDYDYKREAFGEFCRRHSIVYAGDCHLCEAEWADAREAEMEEERRAERRGFAADMLDAQEGF